MLLTIILVGIALIAGVFFGMAFLGREIVRAFMR